MLIYYNKNNGEIIGTEASRITPEEVKNLLMIIPDGLTKEDIGVFEIPMMKRTETVLQPIFENRVVDMETLRVESVQVGEEEKEVIVEVIPIEKYEEIGQMIEAGTFPLEDYKVLVNTKGIVKGIFKKDK